MKQLKTLVLREKYYAGIEYEINRILLDLIYRPLAALFAKPSEILNAGSVLLEAVATGRVWYEDGLFSGEFSSRISSQLECIGATYNPASRTFSLPSDRVPTEIRIAQAQADSRYDALRRAMVQVLDGVDIESLTDRSGIPARMRQSVDWMEGDFQKTVAAITIAPKLTEDQRRIISGEWGKNLELYIQGWAKDNILELRQKVSTNAFAGRRAEELVSLITENYGVSRRKAKFLARQETSLLMSKFQQTRYQDIGIRRYRWSTSHDERVRHDHKVLDGKVFSWDDPPITDRETGARNNPGEDFNCRCIAVALVE
ncbi:MAG: minor capsid protein [Acidobacteriia bacterium]|nr:minor capsid protein [Terriglobia bacterium]